MRLDKSHNLSPMRLAKFHDPTISRTDLNIGSDIRLIHKFANSLAKTSDKRYEPKTYDEANDNLIHKNKSRHIKHSAMKNYYLEKM